MQLTSTTERGCISENCVKNVQIRSFLWSVFPAFVLNTEYLSVFSPNTEKYGLEKLRIWTLLTQWKTSKFEKIFFIHQQRSNMEDPGCYY